MDTPLKPGSRIQPVDLRKPPVRLTAREIDPRERHEAARMSVP
jgi:hypothetical protein